MIEIKILDICSNSRMSDSERGSLFGPPSAAPPDVSDAVLQNGSIDGFAVSPLLPILLLPRLNLSFICRLSPHSVRASVLFCLQLPRIL